MKDFEAMKRHGMEQAGTLGHHIPGFMDYMVGNTRIGIGHCAHRCSTWVVVCRGGQDDLIDGPALVYRCAGAPAAEN
jgi:hypothetical protein